MNAIVSKSVKPEGHIYLLLASATSERSSYYFFGFTYKNKLKNVNVMHYLLVLFYLKNSTGGKQIIINEDKRYYREHVVCGIR